MVEWRGSRRVHDEVKRCTTMRLSHKTQKVIPQESIPQESIPQEVHRV